MTGPSHVGQVILKLVILLSQLPNAGTVGVHRHNQLMLLLLVWNHGDQKLEALPQQRIAISFVSNHKLKPSLIKVVKSNWQVQFRPSLVLKNTLISGSKTLGNCTQALRPCRLSQVSPFRLNLPVQAVTLGHRTRCQWVLMWPRVDLWESHVLWGRCRDLVGGRGSLFTSLIQFKWNHIFYED